MPKELFNNLSFSFNYDNPFPEDSTKTKLNAFKKAANAELGIDFDTMDTDIKYYEIAREGDVKQLYGDDSKEKKINEIMMIDDIKMVVSKVPQLRYFNEWINKFNFVGGEYIMDGNNEEYDEEEEDNKQEGGAVEEPEPQQTKPLPPVYIPPQEEQTWDNVIPIQPYKFDYSKTNGLTNYDITGEKQLTYDEIRKLTVNIARSKLKMTIQKSEQVLELEKEKRKELMNNIQKYRNINAIGVLVEENIQDMNLSQLEHTLNYCEKLYKSQKLKEVIKRGANFGGLILGTVFPDGIKIGKSKRVKLKGTTKTIIENVFDTQSTVGVAFQNIMNKHNWNITDEAVIMLSLGEMFISSIKVENIDQKDENKNNTTTSNTTNVKKEDQHLSETNVISEYYEEEEEYGEYEDN